MNTSHSGRVVDNPPSDVVIFYCVSHPLKIQSLLWVSYLNCVYLITSPKHYCTYLLYYAQY